MVTRHKHKVKQKIKQLLRHTLMLHMPGANKGYACGEIWNCFSCFRHDCRKDENMKYFESCKKGFILQSCAKHVCSIILHIYICYIFYSRTSPYIPLSNKTFNKKYYNVNYINTLKIYMKRFASKLIFSL